MANTYTQIHIQFVFAVKYREGLIHPSWKDSLHQYICGILRNNEHKPLAVNSMPDHLHILAGCRLHQSFSALIQNIKTETTKWIKHQDYAEHFAWQNGFGAFSYSRDQLPRIANYIRNQEAHHQRQTFLEEYLQTLKEFDVAFDEQYIFKEPL